MQERIRAVVNEGRIEPLEKLDKPDGTEVLVTALSNGDDFWLKASEPSLKAIGTIPRTMSMPSYSKGDVVLVCELARSLRGWLGL